MQTLGQIRSKFGSIPVPGETIQLNGGDLITNGRSDVEALRTALREMLDSMTYNKLAEDQATRAENMNKQLKFVPMPQGKAIFMG